MYEIFTKNDFRTFKHWLAFIKEITRVLPYDYVLWYVQDKQIVVDIPDDDYGAIQNADYVIAQFLEKGVLV